MCEWKYWLAVTKGKPYKAKDTIKLGFDQINKGTLIVDVQWFELLGNDRHTAGIERASSIHRYKRLPEVCQIRVKSIIPNTNLKWKMISKNGELGVLLPESHDALMEHNLENYV